MAPQNNFNPVIYLLLLLNKYGLVFRKGEFNWKPN